jgi:hypothetical protein
LENGAGGGQSGYRGRGHRSGAARLDRAPVARPGFRREKVDQEPLSHGRRPGYHARVGSGLAKFGLLSPAILLSVAEAGNLLGEAFLPAPELGAD